MNHEAKKIWVEALRSGKYEQGKEALCSQSTSGGKQFCCLGVLVDCYMKHSGKYFWQLAGNPSFWHWYFPYGLSDKYNSGSLPDAKDFRDWIGNMSFSSSDAEIELMTLNDDKDFTFAEIADWIEENL